MAILAVGIDLESVRDSVCVNASTAAFEYRGGAVVGSWAERTASDDVYM